MSLPSLHRMHSSAACAICAVSTSDNTSYSAAIRYIHSALDRLQWYGHVLRKEDNDWVKKCMEYEKEGSIPRDIPKRTWREVVQKDCQACKLNREDVMDCSR